VRGDELLDPDGLTPRCGSSEPGTAATANKKSSCSAVRMLVSWRQVRSSRSKPRRRARPGCSASSCGAEVNLSAVAVTSRWLS